MSTGRVRLSHVLPACVAALHGADRYVRAQREREQRLRDVEQDVRAQGNQAERYDARIKELDDDVEQRGQQLLVELNGLYETAQQYAAEVDNCAAMVDAKATGLVAPQLAQYREMAYRRVGNEGVRPTGTPEHMVRQLGQLCEAVRREAYRPAPQIWTAEQYYIGVYEVIVRARCYFDQLRDVMQAYYDQWHEGQVQEALQQLDEYERQLTFELDRVIGDSRRDVELEHQRWERDWRRRWSGLEARIRTTCAPDTAANQASCWPGTSLRGQARVDASGFESEPALASGPLSLLGTVEVSFDEAVVLQQGEDGSEASIQMLERMLWPSIADVSNLDHRVRICSANGNMDYSPQLMRYVRDVPLVTGGKLLTRADDIARVLCEHVEALEDVLQNKLVGYASVEEFNRKNPAKPIPWRLLCISHLPARFDERMMHDLLSLVKQGSRAGIRVLLQCDHQGAPATPGTVYGSTAKFAEQLATLPQSLTVKLIHGGPRLRGTADDRVQVRVVRLSEERVDTLIAREKELVDARAARVVPLADVLPMEDFQRCSTARRISLPMGVNEEGGVQRFELGGSTGRGTSHFALVIGDTGSGKSVFLHTLIMSALYSYPPAELEVCLLDFKSGVEFSSYADARLPHLRYVALDSLQQFGESVLGQLVSLMNQRAKRFRDVSKDGRPIASIEEYRAAGHRMPRVLVVMDEFQELFDCDRDRRCANSAASRFGDIISKGRAFGIHMVLATQTLQRIYAGNYAISKALLEQMRVRIGLKCTEEEYTRLMGNGWARECVSKTSGKEAGLAVFTEDNLSDKPIGVRVAYMAPKERLAVLADIERAYVGKHFGGAVVFRGDEVPELSLEQARRSIAEGKLVYLGKPVAIGEDVGLSVRGGVSANMLVLGEEQYMLDRIAHTVMTQVVAGDPMGVRAFVFDGRTLRGDDGVLDQLAKEGVGRGGAEIRLADNAFRVLPLLRDAYECFQQRRRAMAAGTQSDRDCVPVMLAVFNYELIDPLMCLMEGKSVADYEVDEPAAEKGVQEAADPLQAMLDGLAADLAKGTSGDAATPPPAKMLRTLLENGHLCNVHTILTCGSSTVLGPGRVMRGDLAPLNIRVLLPSAANVQSFVDTDIDLKRVPDNCVLYSDGQHPACLVRPFSVGCGTGDDA